MKFLKKDVEIIEDGAIVHNTEDGGYPSFEGYRTQVG
jgi:hypothetical protein